LSGNLPHYHREDFTIRFNHCGKRFACKARLIVDLFTVRHQIGRKAARNGGGRSRLGPVLVELLSSPKIVGPEEPGMGTVCDE